MSDHQQIPVSDELLLVMRRAATQSLRAGEKFITPRMLMIALLNDPAFYEAFKDTIDVAALESMHVDPAEAPDVSQLPEEGLPVEERPALLRYDTLAFKDETGQSSVWLSGEAHAVFLEGARNATDRYIPKYLLLGFVREWRRQPPLLHDLKIDGGKFSEVVFALP